MKRKAWVATIFAAAVLVFSATLPNPFLLDDSLIILENPIVQQSGRALETFANDYWAHWPLSGEGRDRLYRPLTMLSLALNHTLGGNQPAGYRILNIIFHGAASVFLFGLAIRFGLEMNQAGAVALLFALHPVHTESVNAVVGRADLLAAIGVFAGIGLLLGDSGPSLFRKRESRGEGSKSRSGKGKKKQRITKKPTNDLRKSFLVGGLLFLALLSKEIGIALLFWVMIWWVWGKVQGKSLSAENPAFSQMMVGMVVALAVYLAMRYAALGMWTRPVLPELLDNPLAYEGLAERLIGALGVLGRYFKLLVWPWPLAIDRSYAQITVDGSATWTVIGMAVLAAWLIAAWHWKSSRPEVAFGLALFIASFFPVSNLMIPIGTVMAERLMYLPSAGFLIAVVPWAAGYLKLRPKVSLVLLIAVGILFGGMTWTRNRVWADPLVFWEDTVQVSPKSARALRLYGKNLYKKGKFAEAISPLRRSIEIYPRYATAWVDLGNALVLGGRQKEAAKSFKRALQILPHSVTANFALGQLYVRQREMMKARPYLERTVSRAPHWMEARFMLGNIYMADNQWRESLKQFEAALRISPRAAPVHHNIAIALVTLGNRGRALHHAREAVRLGMRLDPTLAKELGEPGLR